MLESHIHRYIDTLKKQLKINLKTGKSQLIFELNTCLVATATQDMPPPTI